MTDDATLSFSPRPRQPGLATSIVGTWGLLAASSIGILLGVGRRSGTAWRAVNAAAHVVLGSRADDVWGFQFDVTLVGCAVVLAVSAMAGVAIAELTSTRRTIFRTMATGAVVLLGYLVHVHIVARTPGGLAALLTLGELRVLYGGAAIAAVAGMRYAFLPVVGEPLN
ncbi:hypothetical protein BH11GEM1_BH11GEM1_12450 [soil metagenome]